MMPVDQTDEALMIAVRGGDLDQLDVLFGRYRDPLYDFFSRMTRDRVASEDLVQEVFVRILKYRGTYRETNRFIAWMYQIGRNAWADYARKNRPGVPEADIRQRADRSSVTPEANIERVEEKDLLACALAQVSDANRELLILARYQELRYEEIAELYGIELGAVRTRVYRAVRELREVFLALRGGKPCNAVKSRTTSPIT